MDHDEKRASSKKVIFLPGNEWQWAKKTSGAFQCRITAYPTRV
jgi:hypothetical protein